MKQTTIALLLIAASATAQTVYTQSTYVAPRPQRFIALTWSGYPDSLRCHICTRPLKEGEAFIFLVTKIKGEKEKTDPYLIDFNEGNSGEAQFIHLDCALPKKDESQKP